MAPVNIPAQLVVASVRREEGIDIGKRMTEIGVNVGQQDTQSISRSQHP